MTAFKADYSKTKNGAFFYTSSNKDDGDGPADDAATSSANADKGKKDLDEKKKRAYVEAMKSRSKMRHVISSGNIGGLWDQQQCIWHKFCREADINDHQLPVSGILITYFRVCICGGVTETLCHK